MPGKVRNANTDKQQISKWKTKLTDFERFVLNHIYKHWDETGQWPKSIEVALNFDDYEEDYYQICNNLGQDFIEVGNPGQKQDVSSLTLFGIALCDNTEEYIELFIKIIKMLIVEYKKDHEKKYHWNDIRDQLGLDDSYASKIYHLIRKSHRVWNNISQFENNDFSFELAYSILDYKKCETVDDLYAIMCYNRIPKRFSNEFNKKSIVKSEFLKKFVDENGNFIPKSFEEFVDIIDEELQKRGKSVKEIQFNMIIKDYLFYNVGKYIGIISSESIWGYICHERYFLELIDTLRLLTFFKFSTLETESEILLKQLYDIFSKAKIDNKGILTLSNDSYKELLNTIKIFEDTMMNTFEKFNMLDDVLTNSEKVPDKIIEDIQEAINNFYNRSYRSTVIMSRRCLQRALNEQGVKNNTNNGRKKNINEMLKEAYEKGLIDEDEYNSATKIRKYGGWSAHSQDEKKLDKISYKEAKSVVEELFTLIGRIYNDPRVRELTLI